MKFDHPPESLLGLDVVLSEDRCTFDSPPFLFKAGLRGRVTADIDDVLAILFYEQIPGVEHQWVTFKDAEWIRPYFEVASSVA